MPPGKKAIFSLQRRSTGDAYADDRTETPATEEGVETPPTTGETPVEGNPEEAPVNGDNSGMAQ